MRVTWLAGPHEKEGAHSCRGRGGYALDISVGRGTVHTARAPPAGPQRSSVSTNSRYLGYHTLGWGPGRECLLTGAVRSDTTAASGERFVEFEQTSGLEESKVLPVSLLCNLPSGTSKQPRAAHLPARLRAVSQDARRVQGPRLTSGQAARGPGDAELKPSSCWHLQPSRRVADALCRSTLEV